MGQRVSLGSKTFKTGRKQRLKMIWCAREALWTSLILNSLGNSLFRSLQRLRALNFILDRYQTNNTLIYSHRLLYNVAWYKHYFGSKFSFYRSPSCRVALYARLFDTINVNYQQSNKLQVMQIIWNVMLYSQHFTFHWKLLVVNYSS